jgi:hypothetical protein
MIPIYNIEKMIDLDVLHKVYIEHTLERIGDERIWCGMWQTGSKMKNMWG